VDIIKKSDSVFKTPDGHVGQLEIYSPAQEGPLAGLVRLEIRLNEKNYQVLIPQEDYSPRYLRKFIMHFRHCPTWREYFVEYTPQYQQVEVTLITGNVFFVDKKIAPYVQALCDQDFIVLSSAQGTDAPLGAPAHLKFAANLPADLEQVWSTLGWSNLDNSVAPVFPRGWAHEFNQLFLLILDDWMHADLDLTAQRYVLDREPAPFVPEWPKLPKGAMKEHERKVKQDVVRLNKLDTRVTFDDLVGLASGRDSYTIKHYPELKALLKDDPILPLLEERIAHPAPLARALRWRLRGLHPDLILRKIEIEEMLNRRDEKRRKELTQARLLKQA